MGWHGLAGYHGLAGWLVAGWLAWVDWLMVQFQMLKAVGPAIPGAEGCCSIPSALVVLRTGSIPGAVVRLPQPSWC